MKTSYFLVAAVAALSACTPKSGPMQMVSQALQRPDLAPLDAAMPVQSTDDIIGATLSFPAAQTEMRFLSQDRVRLVSTQGVRSAGWFVSNGELCLYAPNQGWRDAACGTLRIRGTEVMLVHPSRRQRMTGRITRP